MTVSGFVTAQGSGSSRKEFSRRAASATGHKHPEEDAVFDGLCQAEKVRASLASADVTTFSFISEVRETVCCRTCAMLVVHACCGPSRIPSGA